MSSDGSAEIQRKDAFEVSALKSSLQEIGDAPSMSRKKNQRQKQNARNKTQAPRLPALSTDQILGRDGPTNIHDNEDEGGVSLVMHRINTGSTGPRRSKRLAKMAGEAATMPQNAHVGGASTSGASQSKRYGGVPLSASASTPFKPQQTAAQSVLNSLLTRREKEEPKKEKWMSNAHANNTQSFADTSSSFQKHHLYTSDWRRPPDIAPSTLPPLGFQQPPPQAAPLNGARGTYQQQILLSGFNAPAYTPPFIPNSGDFSNPFGRPSLLSQRTAPFAPPQANYGTSTRASPSPKRSPQPILYYPQARRKTITHAPAYEAFTRPVPKPLTKPQPLLLVLDLNGTLLFRNKSNIKQVQPRPGLHDFLTYCFANHVVMFWTSAQPVNLQLMLSVILTDPSWQPLLAASWGRDTFGLPAAQYNNRVEVIKDLDQVWRSYDIQQRHPWKDEGWSWGIGNTVLADDTVKKAVRQPWNLVKVPEFSRERVGKEMGVLETVQEYLEVVRIYDNVAAFMRKSPLEFEEGGAGVVEQTWELET